MENKNNVPAQAGGAGGGPAWQQNRVPVFSVDDVRSYMFEMESREVLHLDRLGADDVARALEKLAMPTRLWVCSNGEELIMKLAERWRVKIMRDAVVIKVTDYVLIADSRFLLMRATEDGFYEAVAKGNEITWDGTEEYFTSLDVIRLAKGVARRILEEQAHWI